MEHCLVSEGVSEVSLAGLVVAAHEVAWRIDYEIRCDGAWKTRTVTMRAQAGVDLRSLALTVDGQGRWIVDGAERPDLHGCVDVDLGFSPSTNTLPIRRLRMGVQQSETIEAAWVQFPSLVVSRVPQRYTRISERTYRYENLPTGFSAEVDVDSDGFVTSYPPGWERVFATPTN
jgi:hypothetical protein